MSRGRRRKGRKVRRRLQEKKNLIKLVLIPHHRQLAQQPLKEEKAHPQGSTGNLGPADLCNPAESGLAHTTGVLVSRNFTLFSSWKLTTEVLDTN